MEDGLLQPDTATLLWKTWSARRPVIHVIDDPAPSPVESSTAASKINQGRDRSAVRFARSSDGRSGRGSNAGFRRTGAVGCAVAVATSPPDAGTAAAAAAPAVADDQRQVPHQGADAQGTAGDETLNAVPANPTLRHAAPGERHRRAAWLARQIWHILLAACVLSTAAQVGRRAGLAARIDFGWPAVVGRSAPRCLGLFAAARTPDQHRREAHRQRLRESRGCSAARGSPGAAAPSARSARRSRPGCAVRAGRG